MPNKKNQSNFKPKNRNLGNNLNSSPFHLQATNPLSQLPLTPNPLTQPSLPQPHGPFGNVILITLFMFFENTCR